MKVMMDRVDNKDSVKFRFCQKHMANKNVVSAYNAMTIRMDEEDEEHISLSTAR